MTSSGTRSLWAIITMTVVIGFVASLPGCASVGPVVPVVVSDVKSVAGTWQGVVYGPGSEPDYVELTIRDDGSYDLVSRQAIGESRGRGKIVLSGGRLIMEGERGRGVVTLMRNQAGNLVMNIDATLSDNSTLSAKLWRSS
jgi:hypothetical protein